MRGAIRDWTAVLAVFAAFAVIAYGLTAQHGWIETVTLWPVQVFGLVMVALAIRFGASKLFLLLTPVFLVPLSMGAMLLYACSQGDCL